MPFASTAATNPTCASAWSCTKSPSASPKKQNKSCKSKAVSSHSPHPARATIQRKPLDDLTEKAKSLGARGAYFVKLAPEGTTSTVEKLIGAENVKKLAEAPGARTGDLVVAVSARQQIKGTEAAALIAGQLRLQLGEAL